MNYIKVTTQFEGQHRWKDAPDEVSFLRNWHRHIFYVTAWFTVQHSDRDLEFFIQKRKLTDLVRTQYENKKFEKSCEMIAEEICRSYQHCYKVEVSEDNENGGGFVLDNPK